MLELKNIVKDYVSGNNITHALKGISVNFRKNEFVSILGASGCGKTTTLNIIGGLDRYTSGDLIINGKSTKNYTDRDWDTYRNHSIGFIFQSYNLIFHQNILKNVELALTISGVDKTERRKRALAALETVGLKGLEKKKPNQLSGGQCQRVAIARALINNPEILLADEPTGALDSETSIQIMELLKDVAKDRLVIMVTHNPDLAKKYSTRIITMSDGILLKDSKPFDGKEKVETKEINKGKKKHSSMNLITSTGLSLSNLASKIRRTILVTIAGSIGIIGVASVLAVSQGVKDFIKDMQDDMLSSYPIEIKEESVDYTSLMSGLDASTSKDALEFDVTTEVGVNSMINFLMTAYSDITKVKTNTIDQKLVDYIDAMDESYAASVFKNYNLDPTNNIFGLWDHNFEEGHTSDVISLNGLTQSYIAELKTVQGFKSYASYVNLFTGFMNELPGGKDYIMNQYDLIAGEGYADDENEMMLVVDGDTTLTDLLLAEMGVYDHDRFINIAKLAIKKNEITTEDPAQRREEIEALEEKYPYDHTISFDSLLNHEFYYFPQQAIVKDESEPVAATEHYATITLIEPDKSGQSQMPTGLYNLEYHFDDKIVGTYVSMSSSGIKYDSFEFTRDNNSYVINYENAVSNVTGSWTATNSDGKTVNLNFMTASMATISVDGETPSILGAIIAPATKEVTGYHYNSVLSNQDMLDHPENYGGMKMKISGIIRLKDERNFGSLSRGLYYSKAFAERYMSDANKEDALLTNAFRTHIEGYKDNEETQTSFNYYVQFDYLNHENDNEEEHKTHGEKKFGYASALNGDMSSSFSDLFSAITGVNYLESDSVMLRSVCGLKADIKRNEDETIKNIEFNPLPKSISIFPEDFDNKDKVTDYLDKWNDENLTLTIKGEEIKGKDRDTLTYSDTIEIIIAVINTFIDAITIALVVFTSLSLVVSCFMIAVITYISVVERIKEIGIIRSLGGRKGDVASLFIMENLLTGLFSGGFGIAITYVLQIILNAILKLKFGIIIANLTLPTALIMIGVSILLSVLSGFIPSQSAAHKDPVVALRSAE